MEGVELQMSSRDCDKTMARFTMLSLMRSTWPPLLDLRDELSIDLLGIVELGELQNLWAPKSISIRHREIKLTLVP